jgi:hypothetical protein
VLYIKTEITIPFGMIKTYRSLHLLYSKVNELEEEGLKSSIAYASIIGEYSIEHPNELSAKTEVLLTTMYVFYVKKVFHGIDVTKTRNRVVLTPKNIS